ncbi:MAG TPA: hypothetical protein VGS80_17205 [Ktedonobacterales bacterium]|nr:hypothetical protein [Ktedonobacterales bacterium]
MQRNDMVALVAGTSVGFVGGALGVFLACIAGEAAVLRFLVQLGDRYIELEQPPLPAAHHDAPRANPASASTTPANVPPLPAAKEAVAVAMSR